MKLSPQTVVPSALLTAVLALLTATLPGTATAGTVITGGTEIVASFAYGQATHGVDFTSTTALQINALGYWDSGADGLGTGNSYTVALWDTLNAGTPLASVTISDADALDASSTVNGGQWRYETLGTTVNLISGRTYTLGFYTPSSISSADSLFLNYPSVTTAPSVTFVDHRRFLTGSALGFPSSITTAGSVLPGQVNAKFVPEPGSAGLMILGSLMLLGRRRKTKG